jgi:RNA recognition motif-containing protein
MGKKRRFSDEEDVLAGTLEGREGEEDVVEEKVIILKKEKPLPEGYVCNACKAVGHHAIYNCPNKISKKKKKTSEASKSSEVAIEEASEVAEAVGYKYSAFVSGLPFSVTKGSLLKILRENMEGTVSLTPSDIILLMFPDNLHKCKGIGYVNFSDENEFKSCLDLNGIKLDDRTLKFEKSNLPNQPKRDKAERGGKSERSIDKEPRCYRCGQKHDPKMCSNPRICYRCKSTEHISSHCPLKAQKVFDK